MVLCARFSGTSGGPLNQAQMRSADHPYGVQLPLSAARSITLDVPIWVYRLNFTRIAAFPHRRDTMTEGRYKQGVPIRGFRFSRKQKLRFATVRSPRATCRTKLARLLYDTLEPIPFRTKLHLRICDGTNNANCRQSALHAFGGGLEFSEWGTV